MTFPYPSPTVEQWQGDSAKVLRMALVMSIALEGINDEIVERHREEIRGARDALTRLLERVDG